MKRAGLDRLTNKMKGKIRTFGFQNASLAK
jgi:hypothetical protein